MLSSPSAIGPAHLANPAIGMRSIISPRMKFAVLDDLKHVDVNYQPIIAVAYELIRYAWLYRLYRELSNTETKCYNSEVNVSQVAYIF